MKLFVMLGISLGMVAGFPVFPQHPTPFPEGEYCTHAVAGQPLPLHPCKCLRMIVDDEDCDAPPREDRGCLQYCTARNCRCPVHCEIDGKLPPPQPGQPEPQPQVVEMPAGHVHEVHGS